VWRETVSDHLEVGGAVDQLVEVRAFEFVATIGLVVVS
jgi:hypothetical protein